MEKKVRCRRLIPAHQWFLAFGLALGSLAQAAPTHELVSAFDATVAGNAISLPVGTAVEVLQSGGETALVKHTLPNGSATLLSIPAGHLKPLQVPAGTSAAVSAPAPPAAPSTASSLPVEGKVSGICLAMEDGKRAEGHILRVEKRHVVLLSGEGEPRDLVMKNLDKPSLELVEKWKLQEGGQPSGPDPRVVPGKKISLEFPELGASRSSDPARIQIRIPENYQPDKPVPLALFFGGGEGSDNCDALGSMVDSKEWILAAFPYPKSVSRPLHAVGEKKSKELIEFQEPMLERLQALVPNTDPRRRVVVGTSNGAHMIGVAACDGWKDFTEYFSAYILHEGGANQSGDFGELRKKAVLVLMGETSEHKDFAKGVASSIERARAKPEVVVSPGEGHGMGDASRRVIREWIAQLPAS